VGGKQTPGRKTKLSNLSATGQSSRQFEIKGKSNKSEAKPPPKKEREGGGKLTGPRNESPTGLQGKGGKAINVRGLCGKAQRGDKNAKKAVMLSQKKEDRGQSSRS